MGALPWTIKELNLLKSYYLSSNKSTICSLLPNRSYSAITCKANNLGIYKRHVSSSIKNSRDVAHFQYLKEKKVNLDFFTSWSIEMAWVLGVITSDGCVSKDNQNIRLSLKVTDLDCVEKVRDLVAPGQSIVFDENGSKARFGISSIEIKEQLRFLGVMPKKSLVVQPPKVPRKYIAHYLRGLLDGDGSIYIKQAGTCGISFCGNDYIVTYIRDVLVAEVGLPVVPIEHKMVDGRSVVSSIAYFKKSSVISLGNFLYVESTSSIRMTRKYNKFLDILDFYDARARRFWQPWEDAILIENYSHMQVSDITLLLPYRTNSAVAERVRTLDLQNKIIRSVENTLWQPWEEVILKQHLKSNVSEVSKLLPHRTEIAIKRKIHRLQKVRG